MSSTVPYSDAPGVSTLQLLHTTSVEGNQIDQLGHMNVRFYGVHALAGARVLLKKIGLPKGGARATFTDLYTRHYREQLEGSPLEVWGGVLDVREAEVQLYLELRNPVREELGATFVFTIQQQATDSHEPRPLDDAVADAARDRTVAWPEHGRPRSIDLDATPRVLSIKELESLDLPTRHTRIIDAKDCDENGIYRVDVFQDLVWGSEGISEDNDWLRDLPNGEKMGWATMESRCTMFELPRAGTRVQSFCATVGHTRKAEHEKFWVYDIDHGMLLCAASFVDVAFNINTRRAIEIPDFEKKRLEEHLHPELL